MNELADWQQKNTGYLSAAVAWLKARLEQRAAQERVSASLTGGGQSEETRSFWQQLAGRLPAEAGSTSGVVPAAPAPMPPEAGDRTAADLRAAASEMHPPPALVILSQRLGLSQFEQEILLLCAAMELDTGVAPLCARAQRDSGRPYPTFALALGLFDEPAWDALSPERPLRYWRLLEISQPPGQPLTVSLLRADERIVNYLKGLNYLDDRLGPLLSPLDLPPGDSELPPSQRAAMETIVRHLRQWPAGQKPPVIQLLGTDAASKQLVASHAADALGLRVYRLPATLLPQQAVDLETLARLWQREILLLPVALYLDALGSEIDSSQAGPASPANRLLARVGGVSFLDTRDVWPGLGEDHLPVDVAKPTPDEQHAAWRAALGEAAGDSPALLAAHFSVSLAGIQQIARQALAERATEERAQHDRLWDACLAGTRPRLDMLAQRVEPKATWDDIVLPAAETNLLHQIADQVRRRAVVYHAWGFSDKMSRGLGISALLTGDSGTGKTMAAEVIANHLRLNLYRIDLSAVVSKYIGETEKNLRRLFDAAEDGAAILFFDEADALFGKRSEVKDSHDRYANIEINYLLQRMEAYRGLAILATNMRSALDPAFLRRLRFVVHFQFPGAAERRAIWQKAFPRRTPTDGLDFERLARLNLTGGNIQSIALNSAFLAARAGTPVTMPLVLDAARTELRKLDRPVHELDFRWQEPLKALA